MVDLDALTNGPCQATFGEPVVYQPVGGRAAAVVGIFDESYLALEPLGDLGRDIGVSAQITTAQPALGIQLAIWPSVPQQDDAVVIRGIRYLIREVRQDGKGWALLRLNVV